jgi:hypothetical protein
MENPCYFIQGLKYIDPVLGTHPMATQEDVSSCEILESRGKMYPKETALFGFCLRGSTLQISFGGIKLGSRCGPSLRPSRAKTRRYCKPWTRLLGDTEVSSFKKSQPFPLGSV